MMDWEALSVIGLFALVLGVLLYVLARIWIKRMLRVESDGHSKLRLTKIGWVLICVTILVLFGGFSLQYIAPRTTIGQFVNTSSGRFLYLTVVVLIFWLVETILKVRGIKLIKEDE